MRIFIRADANPEIGMGHVMRCLSIADALRAASHNNQITFLLADDNVTEMVQSRGFPVIVLASDYKRMEAELASWPEDKNDLVIVDSYFVTASYMTSLQDRGKEVAYIDDLAAFPYPVDILINYNAYVDKHTYTQLYEHSATKMPRLILGQRYAPLRSMFQNMPRKEQSKDVRNVLISTGGADPLHLALNMVKRLLAITTTGASSSDEQDKVCWHILLGALNQDKDEIKTLSEGKEFILLHEEVTDMKRLIEAMDIAVSAAGSTLYEIAACGVPLITYSLADNQLPGAEAFSRLGLAVNVGDLRNINSPTKAILEAVTLLVANYSRRQEIGIRMQRMIDGLGAYRLANQIFISVRPV